MFISAKRACRSLDRLAEHRVPKLADASKNKVITAQLKQFQKIANKSNKSFFVSQAVKHALKERVTALAYRLGAAREGKDKVEPDPVDFSHILKKAAVWKKRQIAFGKEIDLTDDDKERLKEIASYKDYLPYVHWERFFKWALLNHQSVDIFVQFPKVVERINRSFLAARVGTFEGLEYIEKQGAKDIKLLIEGKLTSILSGKRQLQFKSGLSITVDQMFKSFGKKGLVEGDFTYLKGGGAVPWNSFEMGYVDGEGDPHRIDLKQENWHKQLPMLERNITAEEASKRFGMNCNGQNWVLSLVCRRRVKDLDAYDAHSFLRILIPNGDGTYDYTYGWGKFAKKYPQNFLHSLTFLFNPKQGTLQYPDNNEIYTNRETLELHYEMSPEKGMKCLQSFRRDLKRARKNKFCFQILIANCADWGSNKIRKYVGIEESQVMDVLYTDLNPKGLFGMVMKILRRAPDWFRRGFFFTLAIFMGGLKSMHNGKKKVNVLDTPPWDLNRPFHHPGKVFLNVSGAS